MPPRRRRPDPSVEVAAWARAQGATAERPAFLASWRRPPDCIAETIARVMPDPSVAGFDVAIDGSVMTRSRGRNRR